MLVARTALQQHSSTEQACARQNVGRHWARACRAPFSSAAFACSSARLCSVWFVRQRPPANFGRICQWIIANARRSRNNRPCKFRRWMFAETSRAVERTSCQSIRSDHRGSIQLAFEAVWPCPISTLDADEDIRVVERTSRQSFASDHRTSSHLVFEPVPRCPISTLRFAVAMRLVARTTYQRY